MLRALLLITICILTVASPSWADDEVRTVPFVDLERYAGKWYEIARLPNRFQRDCAGATAEYGLKEDGKVSVLNTCYTEDGTIRTIEGEARVDHESNARLKVTFNNFFFKLFSWLIKADYWVIDLAEDYSYAVVGSPNRKYLWILAREPEVEEGLYSQVLARIKAQGFDVSRIIRTRVPEDYS